MTSRTTRRRPPPPVAIPTRYGGVKFRSKLEAGWAEWLDKYGITWAYEPEGFRIGQTFYLPDFWLSEMRLILEIKGILDPSLDKVFAFARGVSTRDIPVLVGMHPPGEKMGLAHPAPALWAESWGHNDDADGDTEYIDGGVRLVRCGACEQATFIHYGGGIYCRICGSWETATLLVEFESLAATSSSTFRARVE